ncbi:hypothetical protein FA10DRAFT_285016 [Acaromyces ingoldii]|uniref:Uncharacterized protein n=1 Tax=Acaromyces ingoldii TaxID=215250 RepID=A0A316YS33_9BASI|nr:hypothetical protein FA10DRAFT_285016 [Acaromyces ingoldii]PWN92119.1 hypothetical protein FA10DRAFT_285016 [Acaromyces ingoldii]
MSSLSPQRPQQPRPVPNHLRSIPPVNPSPRFLQGPLPTIPTSYNTGARGAFQGSTPSRERSDSTFSAASSSVLSSSETCSVFSKTTSPFYGDETSSVRTSSTRPSSAESQSATSKQQQAPPARPPKSPIRALVDLPPVSTPVFTIDAHPSTDRAPTSIATSRRTSSFSLGKLMSRSPSNSSVLSLRDKYHALGSSSTVSLATASDCPASPSLCADNSSHVRRSSSFRLSQKLRSKLAFKPTSPSLSMHCPPTPDDVPITPTSSDSLNIKTSFGAQQQRSFSSRIKSFHPHLGDADDAHSFLPTLGKKEAMLFHLIPSPPPTASSGSFTSSPPL